MKARLFPLFTVLTVFTLLFSVSGLPRAAQAAPLRQGTAEFITVTIQPGDTLLLYTYLYGVTGRAIMNSNVIKDPNNIPLGTVLVIPVVKSFIPSLTTPFYYIGQAGDTLAAVAKQFEMNPTTIANANALGSKNTLVQGVTYLIPAGPHLYTVRQGDTLKLIAQHYHTTVEFLLKGNSLPNPDFIYPNQQIFIPIQYNVAPLPIAEASALPVATETPMGSTDTSATPAPTAVPGTPVPAATPSLAIVPGQYIQVRLKSGENFLVYSIRYGVNGAALRAVNLQIKDPNNFPIGTVVTIPVTASFTPSRTTPFFYVVQSGENAAIIALKFGMSATVLQSANPKDPFASGSTILVPAGPHIYTVQQGDTLKIVAALYATTIEKLLAFNSLPNPDLIYPGQQIFIPIQYNAKPVPF